MLLLSNTPIKAPRSVKGFGHVLCCGWKEYSNNCSTESPGLKTLNMTYYVTETVGPANRQAKVQYACNKSPEVLQIYFELHRLSNALEGYYARRKGEVKAFLH